MKNCKSEKTKRLLDKCIKKSKRIVKTAGQQWPAQLKIVNKKIRSKDISESLRIAGRCKTMLPENNVATHTIEIDVDSHNENEEDLINTILHEIAHAILNEKHRADMKHGKEWQKLMEAFGQNISEIYALLPETEVNT